MEHFMELPNSNETRTLASVHARSPTVRADHSANDESGPPDRASGAAQPERPRVGQSSGMTREAARGRWHASSNTTGAADTVKVTAGCGAHGDLVAPGHGAPSTPSGA